MKCGLTIVKRPYGKKGTLREVYAINWLHACSEVEGGSPIDIREGDVSTVCDGDVHAKVKLDYGYHGDLAEIEVEWKCDKCGHLHSHPELELVQYGLGEFLDCLITHAGEEFISALRDADKERRLKRAEEMRVFMEQEAVRRELHEANAAKERERINARRRAKRAAKKAEV